MCGWIKIPTNIENTVWWKNPNAVKVFLYLCLKSNHEDFNYNGEFVRRGECIASLSEIATHNQLSKQQTRTIVTNIQSTHHLTCKSTHKLTKFSICHLVSYEDLQQTHQHAYQHTINTQTNIQSTRKPTFNQHANQQHIKEIEKDIYINKPPISPFGKGDKTENFSFDATSENDASLKTEADEKKEKSSAKKERKVFVKPTIQEIADYCKERQNNISAEIFYCFYESKGWLIGKSPMKDWRAAIRTWEHKNKSPTQQQSELTTTQRVAQQLAEQGIL